MALFSTKAMSLSEAVEFLRESGVKTSYQTVRKWATRGLRGVRLRTVPMGGSEYVTVESIQRFSEELAQTRATRQPRKRIKREKTKSKTRVTMESRFGFKPHK